MSHILHITPLSMNNCFRGKRYMTPEYRAWREEVMILLRGYEKLPKGAYELVITFIKPNLWTWDLSNCIKTIEDAMVKAEIIHDDRYVVRIVVEKKKGEPSIEVEAKILYNLPIK